MQVMQTTIGKPARVKGIGLHTGCHVSVELKPAPEDTGIVFRRVDLQGFEIEALRRHVSRVVLATTLMKKGVMLSTVEHILSALYGSGIDNIYIDVDSLELPILDGSALPYVRMLEEAGVATVAGTSFGIHGEGYIRFSYANSVENIREAIGRIATLLRE